MQVSSASLERTLKVIVVGDVGVGKTSLIKRTAGDSFDLNCKSLEFYSKFV